MSRRVVQPRELTPAVARILEGPQMPRPQVRARYDAAQTNDDNRRHWANADGLSADAGASPAVRRVLRNRARYEVANNSYAKGMVDTLAGDVIGTVPRLQLRGVPRTDAAKVETEFAEWMRATGFADKLRTMSAARRVDGEGMALAISNPALGTPVQLDFRLFEADQCAHPFGASPDVMETDGIRFDAAGNPTFYSILAQHPGSTFGYAPDAKWVPAKLVLHHYVANRPGQRRGVPELTPALPLFAQLRRWTLAVLAAAETAADFSAVLTADADATEGAVEANPFETIDIDKRSMLTLPKGWDIHQFKAEQPVSTYAECKKEILNEIARCMSVPFNVAAGNSSGYNYSSGKLDWQVYFKALRIDRERLIAQVLDRALGMWMREASLIPGYLPASVKANGGKHQWYFDGFEHVDPLKEANAEGTRLGNLTTSFSEVYGKAGDDWEAGLEQIAMERAAIRKLEVKYGITMFPVDGAVAPQPAPAAEPEDGEEAEPELDENGDPVEVDEAAPGKTPAAPAPGAAPAAPTAEVASVQQTALTGVQITAISETVEKVSRKELSPDAAKILLKIAFPNVAPALIDQMVDAAASFVPAKPEPEASPFGGKPAAEPAAEEKPEEKPAEKAEAAAQPLNVNVTVEAAAARSPAILAAIDCQPV